MTGKERILMTLAGEMPDRVPFVPNIWQWFYVNQERGTLPAVLAQAKNPVEALRVLGADVMSKFDGQALKEENHTCRLTVSYTDDASGAKPSWTSFARFDGGNIRKEQLVTPHGSLTHTWQYEPQTGAPFESEHWWKDFDQDYAAIRAWMGDSDWRLDREALRQGLANVGEDGIILFQLLPTPLKKFHWLAGQEQATMFISDHPEEMSELARIYVQKALAALEEVVDLPGVSVFEVPDNLDSLFYSPALFREFCLPMLRQMARMIHAREKYLFIHACGRLKALAPLFLEAELDCVEGQAHPPLGDWRLDEARALGNRLIVCGGMTAQEQEWTGADARQRIDDHVRHIFGSLGDRRRFLFASGCNTSPNTPYENLMHFRDAAQRHGQFANPAARK